jgi:alpha-galactosidase
MRRVGLQKAGYRVLVLDDCWQAHSRNSEGFLYGDPTRFPSGIKALVGKLKATGFQLGLYTTPGSFSHENLPASGNYIRQDLKLWIENWGVRYIKLCVANTTAVIRRSAYRNTREILNGMNVGERVVLECVNNHLEESSWWIEKQSTACDVWRMQDVSCGMSSKQVWQICLMNTTHTFVIAGYTKFF